jgi:CRP-like cAMP-binding protein
VTAADAGGDARDVSRLKATRPWLSANLGVADRDALARACGDVRTVGAGTDLLRQDTPTSALHILLDGWAARYKIMEDGRRFIPALAVPGDICDLDALRFDQLDYGVTMLSAGAVAVLPRQRADALFATSPAIADAFWSLALAESSILTERAASIGRRSAPQRLAHLLCELLVRLTVVGKADGHSYDLPLTQEHIADVLGLTPVHVNRTLQSLRSTDLLTVQHRRVTIHNWAALSALCGFRSAYLHLETVDDEFAPELPQDGARRRGQLARSARPTLRPSFASGLSAP